MTEPAGPTRLLAVLRQVAEALDSQQQPWALIGGLAVSVRCEPRFTRDIDLAVAVASALERPWRASSRSAPTGRDA